jgi:predicted ArsR family transcriptional regulator
VIYADRPSAPVSPHPVGAERGSRERVLRAISETGPVTATALGEALGITDTAIRRHLDGLQADGMIEGREVRSPGGRRGRGRPARAWVVSAVGHSALTSSYDDLAADALRFLAETAGSQAVADFAARRVGELEQRYATELAGVGDDPRERAEALAAALTRDGYAASARPVNAPGAEGLQMCQGHCPVQHVAAEFPELCDAETDAFSRLLGVHVQRLATLAHGDHVCTTFVPTGASSASAPPSTHPSEGSQS